VDLDVLGGLETPDDGPLVLPGPFERDRIRLGRGFDEDGSFRLLVGREDGKTQIEFDPGVEPIRRLGTDFGNHVEKVVAVRQAAVLFDLEPEGERGVFLRSQHETAPAFAVERADVDVFPRGIDFRAEAGERSRSGQQCG